VNLTELSDAWNTLRNAALGRGTSPNVPAELANDVGTQYEAWRAWLEGLGPLSGTLQQELVDDPISSQAYPWLLKYRALAKRVRAAGVEFASPDRSLLEQLPELPDKIGDALWSVAIGIAVVSIPLAALLFAAKVRR